MTGPGRRFDPGEADVLDEAVEHLPDQLLGRGVGESAVGTGRQVPLQRGALRQIKPRVVGENLLNIQDPLVSRPDLGLNGAEVGAHPVDDL